MMTFTSYQEINTVLIRIDVQPFLAENASMNVLLRGNM